jgi:adenylate cyclase
VTLLEEHQMVVNSCCADHRGTRFHNTGDGFGIWFASADDALACAQEIHRRLLEANRGHSDLPLRVRIGIAAGRPIPFDGDLYGIAVVRAARVCQRAEAGDVLLAAEVLDLRLDRRTATFEFVEQVVLKGLDEPTNLYRIV